jgi:hypothetical protein
MEKMRLILSCLFISLFSFVPVLNSWSQQAAADTSYKPFSGIAVGLDIAPLIIKGFDKSRTGLGFSGRLNMKQKVFAVGEIGYENIQFVREKTFVIPDEGASQNYFDGRTSYRFAYKSNGSYLRAGFEYNMFDVDEPGNLDNVLVGFRYGYAFQQHESDGYTIGNGYWGDFTGSTALASANSHWMELLFGIRTELWKNIFMGWTIRVNRVLSQNHSMSMAPAYIPGFGKYNGKINAGFSYTIEYQIPFVKRVR